MEITLTNQIDVHPSLERFESERESKDDIIRTLSLFSFDEKLDQAALKVENIDAPEVWDQSISYK